MKTAAPFRSALRWIPLCAFVPLWFPSLTSSAQTPEWIWHGDTNASTVYFRKAFRIPPQTWNSRLTVSADDRAEIFLNGVLVARCTDWRQPSRSEVTVRLHQGENVIAVKAENKPAAGDARGLLVHLNVGGNLNFVSDASWLSSTNEEPNWSALSFNAAHWSKVAALAAHGAEPWGEVLFRARATHPDSIKVPDGFKVELLHSASPEEGSWICMTFDDKGRIIISPQGENRPLLRMTGWGEAPAEPAVSAANRPNEPVARFNTVQQVEKIEAPITYAMGFLSAFDSLYVNGIGPQGSGLYRLIDANKNDRYETNELHFLKKFEGGSEHGYHALALGPDKKIYVLNGNGTKLPAGLSPKSPYRNYAEDALTGERGNDLPGTRAPNCYVLRTDAEGKEWELFAGGMRNAYDMDFNQDGELFTFDSDNEWDWGVPWYRPTRIIHLVSGGEAGWRDGTRMWHEDYSGAMPTTADVGIGSPTGVKFARGTNFPPKYQRALFIQDWSYGRIMAVHLKEADSTYTGTVESFLEGAPLNVTSLSFGPDGAMYFITGGRATQSGLYRVSCLGSKTGEGSPEPSRQARLARERRRKLEALHAEASASDLDFIWQNLSGTDPAMRFAARVAIEAVPVSAWKKKALASPFLSPLFALARVGSAEDQAAVLSSLRRFPMRGLSSERQLARVRIIQVALARHGTKASEEWKPLINDLNDYFPFAPAELKREIMRVLLQVNALGAVSKAIQTMDKVNSREEQLFYVELLRNVKEGWTIEEREKFFTWFLPSNEQKPKGKALEKYFAAVNRRYVDGASYDSYLRDFRRQAIATLTPEEKKQLEPLLAQPIAPAQLIPANARAFVREWTTEDLLPDLGKSRTADLARGRQAFVDAQCLNCHRFGNDGGAAGPELTAAASKYSDRDLLEAIIEPSKVINEQYQDHTVFVSDGEIFTGRLVGDSGAEVVIETDRLSGTKEKIPRSKVQSLRPAALSPMPQGLVNVLTKEEIFDLLAYIRTGTTR
jgi:putative heme-binding domain-containing protein